MKVYLVSPPNYIHSQSFQPQVDALREATIGLAEDKTLVLAPHLLGGQDVDKDWILYNCEQIGCGMGANPAYIELLKKHEVWDYSKGNVSQLAKLGVMAKHCLVGYSPCLTRIDQTVNQDIDVLFYGSINERRREILSQLHQKCNLQVAFGVYGGKLDELIARSKIILNVHHYPTAIHEITRTSYLMANKKCVVSELGLDLELETPYYSAMVFEKYEKLVDTCMDLLAHPESIKEQGEKGFEVFSKVSQRDGVIKLI